MKPTHFWYESDIKKLKHLIGLFSCENADFNAVAEKLELAGANQSKEFVDTWVGPSSHRSGFFDEVRHYRISSLSTRRQYQLRVPFPVYHRRPALLYEHYGVKHAVTGDSAIA
jgi:hypothetical protein